MVDGTNRRLDWIRTSIVAMLATAAVCLLGAWGLAAEAEPVMRQPAAPAGDVQVVAASLGPDAYGLYLVDPARETICVYQYVPRERKLKLTAVRRYTFDVQVNEPELQKRQPSEE